MWVCLMGMMALPSVAAGETDSEATVSELNRAAMDAFQNMDIDGAIASLTRAEAMCTAEATCGPELALTYLNRGIIESAGQADDSAARDYFIRAVCLDPIIAIDPMVATPEVESLFDSARISVLEHPDRCAISTEPFALPPPGDIPPLPSEEFPPPRLPQEGALPPQSRTVRHTAWSQQTRLTPLPIYIEVKPGLPVGRVVLSYRTLGERVYQQLVMRPTGRGYAVTIGCDIMQTFTPLGIEYFIVVLDDTDRVTAFAGEADHPFQVTMVDVLQGPAPSLPESPPPDRCTEECPPWQLDCNRRCHQLGDLCGGSGACCEGMICVDGTCSLGDESDVGADSKRHIMRLTFDFGTGGAFVPGEVVKPYNRIAETPFQDWIGVDVNRQDCIAIGYNETTFRDCYSTLSQGIQTRPGVAWSKAHFRVGAMFYIGDRILLGATFRGGLPLDLAHRADVPLVTPLGLANLAFKAVGKPNRGYELDLLVGVGGGIIMHKVRYPDCRPVEWDSAHPWRSASNRAEGVCANVYVNPNDANDTFQNIDPYNEWVGPSNAEDNARLAAMTPAGRNDFQSAYFRRSGYWAIELGVDQYFWYHENMGVHLGVLLDVLVIGNVAYHGDIQLGLATRF